MSLSSLVLPRQVVRPSVRPSLCINVNVNVIVVLNANVLRLDEDRRQRRSGTSIWT